MKLYELAFTSHIYDSLTNFNADYLKFSDGIKPAMDMHKAEHRQELMRWLNQCGSRQFVLSHDAAANELLDWYKDNQVYLSSMEKPLWEMTVTDIEIIPGIFDSLASKASAFGSTGASLILFVLSPHFMIPWDNSIRAKLNCSGNGDEYVEYLVRALRKIEWLMSSCQSQGIPMTEVPKAMGRGKATVAQLVGEYFFVTLTKGCYPPPEEMARP